MKRRLLSLAALFALCLPALFAPVRADESKVTPQPWTVEVTGDSVRIRTGPGLAHPPVFVAEKGMKLKAVESREGWVRVRLPKTAPCWVSGDFVQAEDGVYLVTGSRVNLRATADTKYFPVGQVEKGRKLEPWIDPVSGEKVAQDGFLRVIPPEEATGCIADEFVTRIADAEGVAEGAGGDAAAAAAEGASRPDAKAESAKKREPTKAELEDERKTFDELVKMLKEELQKPADEIDLAWLREMFEQYRECALDAKLGREATGYVEKIDSTGKLLETEKARLAKEKADQDAKREELGQKALEKPAEEPKDEGPVEYLVVGTVGSTGKSAKTPASHRLFDDNGAVLYDLRWDKGDLSKLRGKYVGVVGEVKEYEGWPYKVVVIKRIDVLIQDDEK